MKKIAIYPGRFQPFGLHHKKVFESLQSEFGEGNVYIVTSNKTDNDKSPFSFAEKVKIMTATGIPQNQIKEVRSPYAPQELFDELGDKQIAAVFVYGAKDAGRLQYTKKDGSQGYYKPYDEGETNLETYDVRGYVKISPTFDIPIQTGDQVESMSGTTIRKAIKNGVDPKKIYGNLENDVLKLIVNKINSIKEDLNEGITNSKYITIKYKRENALSKSEKFLKLKDIKRKGDYVQASDIKIVDKDTEKEDPKTSGKNKPFANPDNAKNIPDFLKNVTGGIFEGVLISTDDNDLKSSKNKTIKINGLEDRNNVKGRKFFIEPDPASGGKTLNLFATFTSLELNEDFYDPRNKYYDFAKTNDPEPKRPVQRAYKYKRGGMYTGGGMGFGGMYEDAQFEKGKVLHVYDFDDTIAQVKANIRTIITSPNDPDFFQELDIASTEFPEKSKELEARLGNLDITYDFGEFEKQINDAIVNSKVVNKLKNSLSRPDIKTTILTARSIGHPVTRYLRKKLGLDAYVVPLGMQVDGKVRGIDKANWIEKHIKKGYQTIYFIDDSEDNRTAVAALKDKYPDIILKIENPAEVSELMYGTMTKQEKAKHDKNMKRLSKDLKKINKGNRYVKVPKYIKGTLKRKLYEKMSVADLDSVETYADNKLDPIDIEFTNHFFDRLNDPRNKKEISNAELIGFFKRLAKNKKSFIEFLKQYKEVVATDNRTNLNIPFVNQANKAIAKTVLRKPNFQTSNPQLSLERKLTKGELKDRERIAQDLPDKEFKKRYGKDWKSVKLATATKLAKKNENYPPYKADQVQKVRYQASDTFTNSPKQAKKRGYLEEIGIDLSNYKGQILPGDVLRAPKGFPLGGKKLEKSIQLKVIKNSREGVNRYKLSLEDKDGKKYTVRNFQMDGEYKGKKLPKWGLVRKSRKNMNEGDTYEKMAAKGKKKGNLKQGTVRKRLKIKAGDKIPLSRINKAISRIKKMANPSEKNKKFLKALNLAKTLKTTTNVKEGMNCGCGQDPCITFGVMYEADPKVGTGKKPKGSGRRLYTDENPRDTVKVKFSTRQDIVDTLSKKSFKSKPHKRQSQIINLIHQRVRAALSRTKDPQKKAKLKSAFDYIKKRKEASKRKTQRMKKEGTFTKNWWKEIINEILLTEGGAAGHMAHPFNLPNVNNGKQLLDIFEKSADSLDKNPGAVKIDGVNSSIRLVDLDGKKQFVMDRGSKKELDVKGITKDDLLSRFGDGHGMVKVGGEVLDMFNEALPRLTNDLKKLGAYDNPNILFNMEYVSGKTNVQEYGSNFIAIHGLNKIESKEVQGKRKMLTKRVSSEINYDKNALESLLKNLEPIAKKRGYEVYGSVPTNMKKKPNFNNALSKNYTVNAGENSETKSLGQWLNSLNNIPEEDFIFMNVGYKQGSSTVNRKKVGAVSKQVYLAILNGENIDGLFEDEKDREKAIQGFVTYLATEKLGDEVLKVLDSPMGSVDNHEGVVIRDNNIANVPFKITGKFILGGLATDFR